MGRPPAYIFVVRHGNRLDAADQQWHLSSPTPYDPPLTLGGWMNCRVLGERIGEILRERILEGDRPNPANAPEFKSRQFKVVIHSSPFLRCVQTSTAISAGLASGPLPLQSPEHRVRVPTTAQAASPQGSIPRARPNVLTEFADSSDQPGNLGLRKSVLRLDAFLGEWLSPSYFEQITPPPSSVMMVASAKAELLRKEDYSSYPHFHTHAHHAHSNSSSQLWGSRPWSSTVVDQEEDDSAPSNLGLDSLPEIARSLPRSEKASSNVGESRANHFQRDALTASTEDGGYIAPVPSFSVSSNAPIPAGYVAHARDACVDIDYQWDSMRAPYDWGDGGELGEEWAAMHRRFRKGIQLLVDWYSTGEHPTDMVTKTAPVGTNCSGAASNGAVESSEVETVVILVSHGAGCNALVGAITHQPVLADVGMASLTMAVRRPGKETAPSQSGMAAAVRHDTVSTRGVVPLHEFYDLKIFASGEHLRSPISTPGSSRSPSMARLMGSHGRHSNSFSTVAGHFSYADSGSARSSSVDVLAGGLRRGYAFSSTPRTVGGITVGSGVTSFNRSGLSRTPSFGLWSPVIKQDEEAVEDEDDVKMLDFSNAPTAALAGQGADARAGRDSDGKTEEARHAVASPTALSGEPEKPGLSPQLGSGAGGLWGSPSPMPPDVERFGSPSSSKRRWTVNESI